MSQQQISTLWESWTITTANKYGKILGCIKQVDGTVSILEMYPLKYCPRATQSLSSITADFWTELNFDFANKIQLT